MVGIIYGRYTICMVLIYLLFDKKINLQQFDDFFSSKIAKNSLVNISKVKICCFPLSYKTANSKLVVLESNLDPNPWTLET